MKIILKGDKGRKSTTVSGEVATIEHVTYHKATDAEYQLTWHFDYTDVSRSELIELATKNLVIANRPAFKNADKLDEESDGRTYNVREYLDKERRRPKDHKAIAKAALAKLSKEEIRELLEG